MCCTQQQALSLELSFQIFWDVPKNLHELIDPFFIHFYRLFCGVQFLTTASQSSWRCIGIKHTAWLLLKRTWKCMLFWNIIKLSISICIKDQSQNPLFMKLKNMALRKILRKRLKAENMQKRICYPRHFVNKIITMTWKACFILDGYLLHGFCWALLSWLNSADVFLQETEVLIPVLKNSVYFTAGLPAVLLDHVQNSLLILLQSHM